MKFGVSSLYLYNEAMPQPLKFSTKVSGHTAKGMVLRGVPLTKLVEEADFVSTLFLSMTGRKPTKVENKILNTILVSSIDHGLQPSSGFIPRVIAASGNDINIAMASVFLALGPYHGAAVSGAMSVFERMKQSKDVEKEAQSIVDEYKTAHKRIPGFGHAQYKDRAKGDPRTKLLFTLALENGLSRDVITMAETLEEIIEWKLKKVLVINVDGGIAALLVTMGIDAKAGNALFALGRAAGSIAHIIEEQNSGQWVRRLADEDIEYLGE